MALMMQLRSRSQALADVAAQVAAVGSQEMVSVAIIAAHLRACCEIGSSKGGNGIHTARLVEAAMRNVSGLLPLVVDPRALVRDILDRLEATGDLWKAEGGHWQPTPARAVVLAGGSAIVLGTAPARAKSLVALGAIRFANKAVLPDLPIQHFDDWLGREDTIDIWMQRAMRSYSSRLQPSGVEADHLEIYAPDEGRRLSQASWAPAQDVELAGVQTRLCRTSASQVELFNRPYFLGEFVREEGSVRLLRSARLAHDHARRFRFAFDSALGVPRRLKSSRVGDLMHLTVANDLPPQEARVLALGWSASEKVSPAMRRMVFPRRAMSFVAHAFSRLGLTIEGGDE